MKKDAGAILKLLVVCFLILSVAGSAQATPMLSGNVPLDSYVYDHLSKLDGLGLLRPMLPGVKPYNRLQVAGWVIEMEQTLGKQKNPSWLGKALLTDLRREFATELSRLATANPVEKPGLKDWKFGLTYYNGDTARYPNGRGSWQPLNRNNQGYRWDHGMNAYGSVRWEGSMGPDAFVSLTPRVRWGENADAGVNLQSGYLKLRSGDLEFFFGKDASSWGPGRMGNLLLSDNATSMTRFQIATIEPLRYRGWLKYLGPIQARVFLSILDDREYWDGSQWRDHNNPGFYGIRLDLQPANNLSMGFAYTSMFGGDGIDMGTKDYFKVLFGKTNVASGDVANGNSGIDFRWRFPQFGGLQLYGGYYFEDHFAYNEANKTGALAGLYLPRLSSSGDWDLNVELASTASPWYIHHLYPGGHTYGGQMIGDAMGGNANRYSMKLNHYLDSRTQVGVLLERVVQGATRPVSQRTNSVALTMRHRLSDDLLMEVTGGWASMDNAEFTSGLSRKYKFANMQLTHRF